MSNTTPAEDLLGTVRRSPDGQFLAILWPSARDPYRWITTASWTATGYETDETVATWPVVGAVPGSPAAGQPLTEPA
ncbi:hypothetical protein, partial [Streptomyces harbinensis]|uniref:hypothetical protein n=1 Tax=Streptomyces harbinensis TaxID=1176198 RepID=UPI003695FA4E